MGYAPIGYGSSSDKDVCACYLALHCSQHIVGRLHANAAHATRGHLNNDIGVPLTLLQLRGAHRYSVVELGMNHPGEIASLAAMAQPTVSGVSFRLWV